MRSFDPSLYYTMSALRTTLFVTLISSALSHPLDTPIPAIALPPDSQIFPCTATLDAAPQPCATDPPLAYATTQTLFTEVNCGGCLEVSLRRTMHPACPTPTAATRTIDGTVTEWEAVCSPTPTLPIVLPQEELFPRQVAPVEPPACRTTLWLPAENSGSTATVYLEHTTVTSGLPCGGCELVTSTRVGGLGQIQVPGITATEPIGTSTAYVCEG